MKLLHCNKAHIYNLEEELLCTADVVGDVEDTAELRIDGSYHDVLRTEAIVVFLDARQGMVACLCSLSDYEESFDSQRQKTISTVLCTIKESRGTIQRRNDVKVITGIDTAAFFLDNEGRQKTAGISILDISAGGIFCISHQRWNTGQKFSIMLFGKLHVEAEILRIQSPHSYNNNKFDEDDDRYGYGCRFINLNGAEESALRKYVFQQEAIQRKSKIDLGTD